MNGVCLLLHTCEFASDVVRANAFCDECVASFVHDVFLCGEFNEDIFVVHSDGRVEMGGFTCEEAVDRSEGHFAFGFVVDEFGSLWTGGGS